MASQPEKLSASKGENLNNAASVDTISAVAVADKKAKFELLKLSEYKGQNVGGWLASEKLDGLDVVHELYGAIVADIIDLKRRA